MVLDHGHTNYIPTNNTQQYLILLQSSYNFYYTTSQVLNMHRSQMQLLTCVSIKKWVGFRHAIRGLSSFVSLSIYNNLSLFFKPTKLLQ